MFQVTREKRNGIIDVLLRTVRIVQRWGATRADCVVWRKSDTDWCRSFFTLPENKSDKPRGSGQRPDVFKLYIGKWLKTTEIHIQGAEEKIGKKHIIDVVVLRTQS